MRYRANICVDVWVDSIEEAENRIEEIVKQIPNSFQDTITSLPHGSKITFEDEAHQG